MDVRDELIASAANVMSIFNEKNIHRLFEGLELSEKIQKELERVVSLWCICKYGIQKEHPFSERWAENLLANLKDVDTKRLEKFSPHTTRSKAILYLMDSVVCFDCVVEYFENILLEEAIKISDQEKEEIAKLFMDELLAIISLLIQDNHKQFEEYVNSLQSNKALKETVLEKSSIEPKSINYKEVFTSEFGIISSWCMLKYATRNPYKYRDHWAHILSLHIMQAREFCILDCTTPYKNEVKWSLLSKIFCYGAYDENGEVLYQIEDCVCDVFENEAFECTIDEVKNIIQLFINELPLIKEQLSQYDPQRCMEYIKTV
ncbi:MAG: hypothetical protein ACRCZM_06695 [Bacteroidales bacterium]